MTNDRAARTLYVGAIATLLLAGTLVRAWGVLVEPLDLWADEAWWATLLESRSLMDMGFRPIGYMWLCGQLQGLGRPEVMLRLPSLVAGIAALYFIYRSAELSYRGRTAVLFVLLIAAFHPKLVVFTKEFKPYSVEVFIFSALTYWALVCLRRRRASAGFLTAALVAIPFCYPVVFLYPGVALALAGERLAALRRLSMRQRVYFVLAALPVAIVIHFLLFEQLGAAQSRWFWGTKYDVFPIGTGFAGGIAWYAQKSWALLTLPGGLDGVPVVLRSWFAIAVAGGVAVLVAGKRYREIALLGAPVLVVALANLLGYWPFGSFRANLFLIPGLLLIGGHSLDWLGQRPGGRLAAYAVVALVLSAILSVDQRTYAMKSATHWAPSPQLTDVLDDIDRRGAGSIDSSDVIVADWHSWRPISFYLRDYPRLREHATLIRGPLADAGEFERLVEVQLERALRDSRPTRLWVVITRLDPHAAILSSEWVRDFAVYRRDFQTRDEEYHPVLFELRPRRLKAP